MKSLSVKFYILFGILLGISIGMTASVFAEDSPTSKTVKATNSRKSKLLNKGKLLFFESKVRPILIAKCFECHSDKKQKGDLRLDSLGSILHGGESGPAIVPGKPDESLLVESINYDSYEMPPKGKLDKKSIDILTQWIQSGAYWPDADLSKKIVSHKKVTFTEEDRSFWSFQKVVKPSVPKTDQPTWNKNAIDSFISRKLNAEGIIPSPLASRETLIRRVYFNLIGLPPTPKQIDNFLKDKSSDDIAFAKIVDQLLESPHYGERWGRHWLDLVRYAESDGYNQDAFRPTIYHYRDYVVKSFNEDKPYPKFVTEQLAGDETDPGNPEAIAATGYLRHYLYEYNQRDVRTHWQEILNDITDATGDVFLGLGMGCARCHNHKFDPILQKDYFRLQAFFTPILPRDDVPLATPEELVEYQQKTKVWEEKTTEIRKKIDQELKEPFHALAKKQIGMFPPDVKEIMAKKFKDRTPIEHQYADLVNRQIIGKHKIYLDDLKAGKNKKRDHIRLLYLDLEKLNDIKPKDIPMGMSVTDVSRIAPKTFIPGKKKKTEILPGFLTLLSPDTAKIMNVTAPVQSTGRRTALAQWITQPDNRLATRVITNRIWQFHFGSGLVPTSSDFGHLGEKPSHPELLDWLTTYFVENGWSFKKMHRLILNSRTYRQSSSHPDPQSAELKDPSNRWHWRADIKRLQAEQIRDASLAISGELNTKLGGPSVKAEVPRRSIYVIVKRNVKNPLLGAFDFPGGIKSTSSRNRTTTPTQSLLMINGPWMLNRAAAMAKELTKQKLNNDKAIIQKSYLLAYGRKPTEPELKSSIEFLEKQKEISKKNKKPELSALTDFCHVLLNSSEFLYLD
jgi:Protein of unknown function (DUF1553)/Protein of unknown function (DUF1549)/Planctomycete cytochrome C